MNIKKDMNKSIEELLEELDIVLDDNYDDSFYDDGFYNEDSEPLHDFDSLLG